MNEEMKERLIQGETIPDKIDEALLEELADQRACHFGLDILLADSAQDDDLINAVCDELSAERASQNASPSTTYAWSKLAGLAAAGMVCFGSGVFVGWHRSHESALINAPSANHESILQGTERGGYATEAAGIQSWEHFQRLAHHEDTESLAEAYHEISKTLSGPQEREAINLLIYRWAELDPNGALSFLQEQDSTRDVATLFGAWARLDSDAAWGAAMQLEPPSASRAAAQPILAYLAKSDPSQFLERAAVTAVTEDSVWATAFESFVENGEDPTKHLKNLTGKPRREAIRGMARAMAKADAGHALEMAKNLTQAGDRASALTSVLHVMGERDPSAAGKALQEFPGQFPEVEKAIVEQLRKKDPFEAIDWIREFTEDKPKATLFRQLLQQTAKDADDRVFALFDQLLEQEGKNVFRSDIRIDDIFWGTSGLDYTKGIEWVKTLPDDLYGWKYMIPSMIYAWSHHDMDAVIDYVSTVGDPSEKARYDSMIVHNMLSTSWDMEKTWDFATSLPADVTAAIWRKCWTGGRVMILRQRPPISTKCLIPSIGRTPSKASLGTGQDMHLTKPLCGRRPCPALTNKPQPSAALPRPGRNTIRIRPPNGSAPWMAAHPAMLRWLR